MFHRRTWERLDALNTLSHRLGAAEQSRLFAFLRSTTVSKGLQPHHVWALKNDLLNLLREQKDAPAEYEAVLEEIYRNPAEGLIIRDYALQHARPQYPLSKNQPRLLEMLWSAARAGEGSLPGTALLSL